MGHHPDPYDQIRPRIRTLCHPTRAQPPSLDDHQEQDRDPRSHRLVPALGDLGPGSIGALFRGRAWAHRVPRQCHNLHCHAMCLLRQDFLVQHFEIRFGVELWTNWVRSSAWDNWDRVLLHAAPEEYATGSSLNIYK